MTKIKNLPYLLVWMNPNGVVTLPDTKTDTETDIKLGFIELCAAVHTAQTPTQTQITIEPIVVCIGVGVGQCERTIRAEHHWRFRCDAPDPAVVDGDVRGGLPEEGVGERGGRTVRAAGHVQRGDGARHRPGPRRLPRSRGRSGTHEPHASNVSTALLYTIYPL